MDSQDNYSDNIKFLHHKLSSALLPKNSCAQADSIHYHFIIDESTSVTLRNFKTITSCCKKQVEVMDFDGTSDTPKTQVSVFRFNETTKLALDASSDRQAIIKSLYNLPYSEGGTNARVALEEVYKHVQKHNTPKTHHVVILMTDGDLGNASSIIQKIADEQNISVKLAVVFMEFEIKPNFYSTYKLQEHQVIRFKDYPEMESVFNLFTEGKARVKPTIDHIGLSTITARLYMSVPNSGLSLDHFQYEIYDDDLKEIEGVKKARFDEILVDGLQPGKAYRVRVRAVYRNGVKSDWTAHERFVTYSKVAIIEWLRDNDKTLKKHQELLEKLPAAQVHPSLKQMGFRHANILLLGLMGHGKSSFINTAASTFASRFCSPALTQCNPYQTCTTTIKEVDILAYQNQRKNNYIHFFDSFGIRHNRNGQSVPSDRNFENSNYGECLKHILNGSLASGYKEWNYVDTEKINADHSNVNKMIHSIGFIVDVVAMKQEGDLKIIREFLQKLQESSKYRPLIIFTKCDVILQKNLPDKQKPKLRDIWDNQALRQAIEYFLEQVPCVDESDIMLFSNYTTKYDSAEERDYERELLLLHILDSLKERAEGFVRSHFENYVTVVNDDDEYVGDFCYRTNTDRIADHEVAFIKIMRELGHPVDMNFEISYEDDRGRRKTESRSSLFRNSSRAELQDFWSKEDGFSKIKILLKPAEKVETERPKTSTPTPTSSNTVQDLSASQTFGASSDAFLSFASELEKPVKKIKCRQQETLKDLRQRLSLPPNEVFSKRSIGQEGIFTESEEMETISVKALDAACSLHVVGRPTISTPSQSSSTNDKIFFSCSCKNFMKPFKVKGTTAAEIRKELGSRQVEHFQNELTLLYIDGFDIDTSDENEVQVSEMVFLNDEGQKQIRCKCSAS